MKINKEEFNSYEKVRSEGEVNMFDVKRVKMKSGLHQDKVMYIMKNYGELANKYGRMKSNY